MSKLDIPSTGPATESAQGPLAGLTVVITRAGERADGMAGRLSELGAQALVYPTIAQAPPEDPTAFLAALQRLVDGAYDWLILTSLTAVEMVARSLPESGRIPEACRVAAVGPSTAIACRELLGRQTAVVPEKFVAEKLAAALGDMAGQRVLLPNADIARPALEDLLRAAGAVVERVVAYRTVPAPDSGIDMPALLAAGKIDAITFTSGSTARYFVQKIGPTGAESLGRVIIACIGPATADVCRAIGLTPTLVAEVFTEEGLVDALVDHVSARG